jgi:hypothetical protein
VGRGWVASGYGVSLCLAQRRALVACQCQLACCVSSSVQERASAVDELAAVARRRAGAAEFMVLSSALCQPPLRAAVPS